MTSEESRGIVVRLVLGASGAVLLLLVLVAPRYAPLFLPRVHEELYSLSAVALLILSSYLVGASLGVAPAVLEILYGLAAGAAGIRPTEVLETLGLMGSVFLMFAAGSEMDINLLRKYFIRSLAVGAVSFAAPLVASTLALIAVGYGLLESLLAGIGVSTTSVAVVYTILREMGILSKAAGQVVLASAMAVDMLSIIAFVLVFSSFSVELLVYAVAIVVAPPLLARALKKLPEADHEAEIRLIIAALLAIALFSEAVGVHAMLAAFILGVAFSEAMHARKLLHEKVGAMVFGFLSPLFFTTAGLHVEVSRIACCPLIVPLLLMASFPAKVMATHAALFKCVRVKSFRLSTVFGARLTVSTIIAYTGLVRGLLPHELAAGVMVTAVAATLLASVVGGWREVEESLEWEEEALMALPQQTAEGAR